MARRCFRLMLALALGAPPLGAGQLVIDHATVAGARLDEMRRAFTAATGIPTEYGGPHANHATEMAVASFPDGSYLELMGIQARADPAAAAAHVWSQFLRDNAGPAAFAIRVPDAGAEIERLARAGIHVGSPEKSGRTRPDGVALSWETADVGAGPRGSFFPFLIRDFTPREQRVYPAGRPSSLSFTGVGLIVIGVPDLNAAVARYRQAFQLPAPKRQRDPVFGAALAWFEGTPVALAAPLDPSGWLAQRVARYGDSPCAFLLASSPEITAPHPSPWFGHSLRWFDRAQLGWRLGVWRAP
jgi:catechol 2,3-dioxygenase-like lactoylglutathione lyase family enzyme